MKALIFDAGPLINLSMNGLLDILENLKNKFDGKFLITSAVKKEVIDRPMGISRFELGALRIQNLINSKTIEMPFSMGIGEEILVKDTRQLLDVANHFLQAEGNFISIVSEAEMSCLALSAELTKKGVKNLIAIDERTTRMLAENPENLARLMSEKIHKKMIIDSKNLGSFSGFRFIRSSELVYVAYKKGVISLEGKNALEALLYATKFKGSSISFEEINELKKM